MVRRSPYASVNASQIPPHPRTESLHRVARALLSTWAPSLLLANAGCVGQVDSILDPYGGQESGSSGGELEAGDGNAVAIEFDDSVEGAVSGFTPNAYELEVAADSVIRAEFRRRAGTFEPLIDLYSPFLAGYRLFTPDASEWTELEASVEWSIRDAGTYLVVVKAGDVSEQGLFVLRVRCVEGGCLAAETDEG